MASGRKQISPNGDISSGRRSYFKCAGCGVKYGDVLYTGPAGHAPENLCFDCWLWQWDQMVLLSRRGKDWSDIDTALALLCRGYSFGEVGKMLSTSRRTIHNWITAIRQGNMPIPQWVRELWDKYQQKSTITKGV